jgi:hypothetical protein
MLLVIGVLVVFVPWVFGIARDGDKFRAWVLGDMMLLVACLATWAVKNAHWLGSNHRLSTLVAISYVSTGLVFSCLSNEDGMFALRLLLSALWQFDLFVLALCCGRNCAARFGYSVIEGYEDAVPLVVTPTPPVSNLLNESNEMPPGLRAGTLIEPDSSKASGGIGA